MANASFGRRGRAARAIATLAAVIPCLLIAQGASGRPHQAHAVSGLVAAYAFDEGSGGSAADASGNANGGTLSNATWTPAGHSGAALDFNGTNASVRVPDSASLDLSTRMTLEAWVRPTASGNSWRTVVLKEQTADLAYALYANTDKAVPGAVISSPGSSFARGRSVLPTGTWSHVAATYDGTAIRLYVNAAQVASVRFSRSIPNGSGPLQIGGNAIWAEWFTGQIDDVRVYNRALTVGEIQTDMATPVRPPADTTPPTPVAGMYLSGKTQNSLTLSWNAASDNVGVAGYNMYKDGVKVASTTQLSYAYTGLACGTTYTLAIETFDAAGNTSDRAYATSPETTSACSGGDTTAPSTPGNLRVTGSTQTSITAAWNASTDNVGVSGYGLYRNGASVGSATSTSTTFSGLSCGTSYTVAVDAYDGAGNRSAKASLTASTSGCVSEGSASVFVSASGSDSNACTQSAPCLSFARAYAVASPGAVVQVAGGTYGGQNINVAPKSGADVVFRPAAGASVTVGHIDITSAAHVEFRDFNVTNATYNRQGAQYVTYRRVKMRQFFIRGADHISYYDSEVGPNISNDGMNWITAAYQTNDGASDILLDGVSIHDFKKWNAGAHVDCIGIDDVDGLTIRNTKIWNCEHFSLIFGKDLWSYRAARNVVLENNFFDCCYSGYYSIGLGDIEGNMTIRFNSLTLGIGWLGGSVVGVTLDSNVISNNNSANCSKATWRYNVVASGSACGGTLASTGFRSPPSDLHLSAGAAAIGAGNPSSHPATDIDRQARPLSGPPDAGADEA